MAELTVNGITFNYPDPGSEAGTWGQDASDWAAEVTNILETLAPAGTITTTIAPFTNNTQPGNVAGLSFQSSITQAAKIFYKIKRGTAGYEQGVLDILYINGVWTMTQEIGPSNSPGVTFDIDDTSGQVVYGSTNTGEDGTITFKSIVTLA